MIFISSACVRAERIGDAVLQLAKEGFKNIELSGGTNYYDEFKSNLLELKEKYELNYLCHNYFPPPQKDFVINLASCDPHHNEMSLNHCKQAIELSKELGANKYGFHAGFLINIPLDEIGVNIQKSRLFDQEEAMKNFLLNVQLLHDFAGNDVKLYIENNVISEGNYNRFDQNDPFFLTTAANYEEMMSEKPFNLLLDLAHLKVSSNSHGLNFNEEVAQLINKTDYIHISDNDGKQDTNKGLREGSEMHNVLKLQALRGKIITLEVYDGMESLKKTYELVNELIQ